MHPLAAVLDEAQNRVDENDIGIPNAPALNLHEGLDFGVVFRRDLFHDCAPLDFYLIGNRNLSTNPGRT